MLIVDSTKIKKVDKKHTMKYSNIFKNEILSYFSKPEFRNNSLEENYMGVIQYTIFPHKRSLGPSVTNS